MKEDCDYFQPFSSCPSFLSADIICVVLNKRTLRPIYMIVLSKSPDPLDWTQHFTTIGLTPYLPAEVSTFMVAPLCSKLRKSWKVKSLTEEHLMSLPWAVSRTEFYLASCRFLPQPDGFALLATSIHSILGCHISAHQRCFASNKMWCLSSAPLCLHPRVLLLIRSSTDLYRSPPSWAIAFREFLFITSDLSSGGRCHYQVRFSDCSAESSCRDSSEGLHVCGYNDRLLKKKKPFVICHLCTPTICGSYGSVFLAIGTRTLFFPFQSVSLQTWAYQQKTKTTVKRILIVL